MINKGDIFSSRLLTSSKLHKEAVIYKCTNTNNDKIYIGGATVFHRRFINYKNCQNNSVGSKTKIYRAIKEYGFDTFQFEILEVVTNPDILLKREQYWIDLLQPFGEKGYNVSKIAGSVRGMRHTERAKKKMSESWNGRVFTAEWRRNLSISAKARADQISIQKSRAVLQIDPKTLLVIAEYKSVRRASIAICGKNRDVSIGKVCRRESIFAYGYYWVYKSEYEVSGFTPLKAKPCDSPYAITVMRPVLQVNERGDETLWDSITDAARACGVKTPSNIARACKSEGTAYGFYWRYVVDEAVIEQIHARRMNDWRIAHNKLAA